MVVRLVKHELAMFCSIGCKIDAQSERYGRGEVYEGGELI